MIHIIDHLDFTFIIWALCGPGSSVGVATDYGLDGPGNPPNVRRIPRTFEYLRICALEWAYLEPRRQQETLRHFMRRVYGTLRSIVTTATPPREVRVTQIQRGIDRGKVWNNLHNIPTSEGARSAWYAVLHDLLPTNTKLHRIQLA